MGASRIVLWRHGQTDWNSARRIQGAVDIPLNGIGRAQAIAVAPQIVKLGVNRIVSSDLGRALETAAAVADLVGLKIETDMRLRERAYGQWEGLTSEQILDGFPEQWQVWRNGYDPQGVGVESRDHCGERFAQAVNEAAIAGEDGSTLLVVSHGGIISNGLVTLLDARPSEYVPFLGMDNCHWALLREARGRLSWRVASYNRLFADAEDLE